jgi:hypothetical protein
VQKGGISPGDKKMITQQKESVKTKSPNHDWFGDSPACLLPHNSKGRLTEKDKGMVHLYEKDVIFVSFNDEKTPVNKGGGLRGNIKGFSEDSKRRLLFVCRNSGHYIKSQICLTYHRNSPKDGKTFKKHLNNYLTKIRQSYSGVYYLWCLEFQKNGHPHAHLFLSLDVNEENRTILAKKWNETIEETDENYRFTAHPKNFFKWDMKSGKYLAKEYVAKADQKDVPEEYLNVGRFWGCSRNMIPKRKATLMPDYNLNSFSYKKARRAVMKYYEKKIQKYIQKKTGKKKKIKYRGRKHSVTIPHIKEMYVKLVKYFWFYRSEIDTWYHQEIDYSIIPDFENGVPF